MKVDVAISAFVAENGNAGRGQVAKASRARATRRCLTSWKRLRSRADSRFEHDDVVGRLGKVGWKFPRFWRILNSIPMIEAEAGGGEVASNVFIRGLPSGGQYQFTPLMYDGIPVLSSFGLNSSAYDVCYRNDLGLDRLEFMRAASLTCSGPVRPPV